MPNLLDLKKHNMKKMYPFLHNFVLFFQPKMQENIVKLEV